MRESPILFNAPMVRAILDGRKTVTRRIMKPQPTWGSHPKGNGSMYCAEWKGRLLGLDGAREWLLAQCPYGKPGDRLWVRETFMRVPHPSEVGLTRADMPHTWEAACAAAGAHLYRADDCSEIFGDGQRWTPSIHMPRAASRITLEVTGVRVERLHDITEEQARAEGVQPAIPLDHRTGEPRYDVQFERPHFVGFAGLWNEMNGADSWDANPWVWAVSFRRIEQEARTCI